MTISQRSNYNFYIHHMNTVYTIFKIAKPVVTQTIKGYAYSVVTQNSMVQDIKAWAA